MVLRRRQFLSFTAAAAIATGCQRTMGSSLGNLEAENAKADVNATGVQGELNQDSNRTPSPKPVRMVVISDLNSQYGSTDYEPEVDQVIRLIPDWQPDLVLCGGDMVAGQKQALDDATVRAMWEAFDQHIRQPLAAAKIPLGFTLGNHDGSGAMRGGQLLFERDRNLARDYWTDPAHDPGLNFIDRQQFPFYYSFQQNHIFYLAWDASTAAISDQQLAWVEQSLASEVAQSAPLRIAIGHLPLYPVAVGRDRPGEFLQGGDQLRSLLEQYNVHTYISGHHHAYYPGYRGKLELLYAGAMGGGPRQLLGSDRPAQKTVTIVDVALASGETVYTTYQLPQLQILDQRSLPPRIQSPAGTVTRRDLRLQG